MQYVTGSFVGPPFEEKPAARKRKPKEYKIVKSDPPKVSDILKVCRKVGPEQIGTVITRILNNVEPHELPKDVGTPDNALLGDIVRIVSGKGGSMAVNLNDWEINFIESIGQQLEVGRELTERQLRALQRLHNKIA